MFVSDWLFSPVKISIVYLETICCDSNGIPTSSYGQFVYMCLVVAKNLKSHTSEHCYLILREKEDKSKFFSYAFKFSLCCHPFHTSILVIFCKKSQTTIRKVADRPAKDMHDACIDKFEYADRQASHLEVNY